MALMKAFRRKATTKASSLTVGLAVFRGIRGGFIDVPSAKSLARNDGNLLAALNRDLSLPTPLPAHPLPNVQRHISSTFKSTPLVNPKRLKTPNFLRTAKHTLPHERKILSYIVTGEGSRIHDSKGMATALKAQWEPVWNRPSPPSSAISAYLQGYDKKLTRPIPPLTAESVRRVMTRPRDSSGPLVPMASLSPSIGALLT